MTILIIEDEPRTAELIKRLIRQYDNSYSVAGIVGSVKKGVQWFAGSAELPDLILADIQLSDGTSFDIFENVNADVPVIFLTAFNEYALEAFRLNSIDYLLKPLNFADLAKAFDKFRKTGEAWMKINSGNIKNLITPGQKSYKQRFLIKSGKSYKAVYIADIASFRAEDGLVFACLRNGGRSVVDNSISELILMLDPLRFFQINRNTIVSIDAIDKISEYFNRRLIVRLLPDKSEEIVSRERVQSFKQWLDK